MSDTQLIKDKLDIVDFINEYVPLKPAGINHKGLCPFHHEKSPSFMVSRERQSWHCFGCGKGGDIFSFIQEIEGLDFIDALKILADKAGVPLTDNRSKVESSQKNRILKINDEAARFWYNFLIKMPGAAPAREYLKKRGVKEETIDAWRIGFIPDQWELLTQYLLKKGFSIDDLVASGIAIKKDRGGSNSFYDRFRGRIMFPIWDVHGNIVGFTGRVLMETENSGGKYVNTPQTLAYDKSRVVFGLNFAKQEIKAKDRIVMVEGQMDVVACHQAGMKNVVATSGTALTPDQITLLKRYSTNLHIAFDADAAGQNAAKRGIDLALEAGLNIKIVRIPDGAGKDADECLKNNPQIWFQSVENAEDIMQWYMNQATHGKNLKDPRQKQSAADYMLKEIVRIPYAVERDFWLRELGARLQVDLSVLREDLPRFIVKENHAGYGNKGSTCESLAKAVPDTLLDTLLNKFFSLSIKLNSQKHFSELPEIILSTSKYGGLYEELKRVYNYNTYNWNFVENEENRKEIDILIMQGDLMYLGLTDRELEAEFSKVFEMVRKEWFKIVRSEIQQKLAEAEKNKDEAALQALLIQLKNLQ